MREPQRSSARRRSKAIAPCCCVALLALLASAASGDAEWRRLQAVELEAGLAKKPDLYLVLDPPARRLRVKVRGIELASVELVELSQLVFRPLLGRGEAPPLTAPAVWTVIEGPGDSDRETIAPTTLRPYSEEEEREEPATPSRPVAPPKGDEAKPSSFRVELDTGWQLYLVNESPKLGWLRRFGAAVRDGWLRIRRSAPPHPPLVVLVVRPEDAQRLHHLFRTGRAILVLPGE